MATANESAAARRKSSLDPNNNPTATAALRTRKSSQPAAPTEILAHQQHQTRQLQQRQKQQSIDSNAQNATTTITSSSSNADIIVDRQLEYAVAGGGGTGIKDVEPEVALHINEDDTTDSNGGDADNIDATFEQLRQKRRLAKMTFILFLPIAIAVMQCASLIHQGVSLRSIGERAHATLGVAHNLSKIIANLNEEAGRTAVWLVTKSDADWQHVEAAQRATNDSLRSITTWYGSEDPQASILFQNSVAFHVYLHMERLDVKQDAHWNLITFRQPIEWHRASTTRLYNWLHGHTDGICDDDYCNRAIYCPYTAYLYFLGVEATLAEQRAFGATYFKILETPKYEAETLKNRIDLLDATALPTLCASCQNQLKNEQVFIKLSYKQNQALRSSLLKLANICDIDEVDKFYGGRVKQKFFMDYFTRIVRNLAHITAFFVGFFREKKQLRNWSAVDQSLDAAIAAYESYIMAANNFQQPSAIPMPEKLHKIDDNLPNSDRFWLLLTERIEVYARKRADLYRVVYDAGAARYSEGSGLFIGTIVLLVLTILLCPPLSAWYIFTVHRITVEIWGFRQSLRDQGKTIEAERRMADQLLYQMIPKPVADELKLHKKVVPCEYESVTLFFSDVVSFTKISSQSTPMEVVDMLNRMYTVCDAYVLTIHYMPDVFQDINIIVIEKYDVYKVETIGDAYMVVSGAPNRNGMHHASEICRMSLELRYCMSLFHIPHMPDKVMLIRIGIHTGSVVAGVVGKKAPRYCLFGENVTFASRMESSGEPMKLHISSRTKEFLDSVGEFETEQRMRADGQPFTIFFQGANEDTYWLIGCQHFAYRADLADSNEITERNMP